MPLKRLITWKKTCQFFKLTFVLAFMHLFFVLCKILAACAFPDVCYLNKTAFCYFDAFGRLLNICRLCVYIMARTSQELTEPHAKLQPYFNQITYSIMMAIFCFCPPWRLPILTLVVCIIIASPLFPAIISIFGTSTKYSLGGGNSSSCLRDWAEFIKKHIVITPSLKMIHFHP